MAIFNSYVKLPEGKWFWGHLQPFWDGLNNPGTLNHSPMGAGSSAAKYKGRTANQMVDRWIHMFLKLLVISEI